MNPFVRRRVRERVWLAEMTVEALELTARCPDVDEILHYWVRELGRALGPDHVAVFLAEGDKWRRLIPEEHAGDVPFVTEAMLSRALATSEPIEIDSMAKGDPSTILLRYSARDGWRGVLALWTRRRRFARNRVAFAREIAVAIGRSASALRKSKITRDQAVTSERSRWAAELHDGHLQSLSSAKLQADVCLSLEERHQELCLALGPSDQPSNLKLELARLHDYLIATVRESRQFLLELRPPPVSASLFVPWLRDYAADFERESGIPVELRIEGDGTLTSYQVEETTRLLRESLTNVRKHAKAGAVRINLTSSENAVSIAVSDDGIGFDVRETLEKMMDSSHNGLIGIRHRAESLGGEMRLRSEPGKGTTLLFRIPRARKPPEAPRRRPTATTPAGIQGLPVSKLPPSSRIRESLADVISSFPTAPDPGTKEPR